jgi:dTDP-4-dehydrorhamnose reductase
LKKVLVTGATGMLGEKIVSFFSLSSNYKVFATYRHKKLLSYDNVKWEKVDLNNKSDLNKILIFVKPDIIIHCAANVNLEQCELDIADANYMHSNIINEFHISSPNSIFVYISTDSVFNGEKGDYSESDFPDPINNYALTKLKGENQVIKNFNKYLIIRTNIYGSHSVSNKTSLAEWAISKLNKNEAINGFDNVFFNPVYTLQLAMVIDTLLRSEVRGIVNVGCDEVISKFSFLKKVAKSFNFNQDLIIKSNSNNQMFLARRPLNTSLNNSLLESLIGKKLKLTDGINMLHNDLTNKY